jgi:radical SAM superfamily enzyme YgiQ (UPF0313 family)
MVVHLINPSDSSFGTAVITPRWLYVLAGATPSSFGKPRIVDETIETLVLETIQAGDMVGIGIHTGNALRGYEVGRLAKQRGAWVIFGGIHATLYPDEPFQQGSADAVVKGDGDIAWGEALRGCQSGSPQRVYEGGRIEADSFVPARWDLLPQSKYMWASVQTIRGCPKHCSFCSVWRTDGQKPRQRGVESVIQEIVELRRMGFRFIALADDNFYPVTVTDLRLARQQNNPDKLAELERIREERFTLMKYLAELPDDLTFFTQVTMEAAEDGAFLDAMKKAHIKGALVGVEAVTSEGLKGLFKDFNYSGENLMRQLQKFRDHGVHVLGSFIFGLSTDRPDTFQATAQLALKANITFAQFVMLTPFPGTVDFQKWEKEQGEEPATVAGIPVTRYWLIPPHLRPKMFMPHPTMSSEEMRSRTQGVWDTFYSFGPIWKRSTCTPNLRARLAFLFVSKLYRHMYARTGITTDSSRRRKATSWARWIAIPCRKLFQGKPMPALSMPVFEGTGAALACAAVRVPSPLTILR